jgi:hypothetical protein
MDKRPDVITALAEILSDQGYPVHSADVFGAIHGVSLAAIHSNMPQQGAPGAMGPMGQNGRDGRDAFDKYAWHPMEESLMECSWKGIKFQFPLMKAFFEGFPEGELTYGDIGYIRTIYGNAVVERMAMFWRREYEYLTDMQVFLNQEDITCLNLISKSNLSPAPLKDS